MLGLKAIWSKKGAPAAAEVHSGQTSSIPREMILAARPEARPLAPAQPGIAVDTRSAERFVPRRTATVLISDSGKRLPARIINVSTQGVAVEADFMQISRNTIVMVGERKVRPGRAIRRGTVFLFDAPLPLSLCGPDLIM